MAAAGGKQEETDVGVSAKEAELYDRQIRLWGVEAQRRMTSSRVLIAGISAVNCEVCKNVVLSGVNVTLQDTVTVTAAHLGSNFFLKPDSIGQNRGAASLEFVRELNRLATVECVTSGLEEQDDAFWKAFTLVILSGTDTSAKQQLYVEQQCIKHGVQLMITRSCGLYGYLYVNLHRHTFIRSSGASEGDKTEPQTITYPNLTQTASAPWKHMLKHRRRKPPAIFFAFRAFLELEAASSMPASTDEELAAYAAACAAKHGVPSDCIDVTLLKSLLLCRSAEVTPVAAVVGGLIAQEVVKALSMKDAPVDNVLVFDGSTGSATIVRCGKTASE